MFYIKDLCVKVKFSTANAFAKKYCKGKSILELLPEKLGEVDGEFLVEMLNFFQDTTESDSKKYSKEEIEKLLDDVFIDEDSGLDAITVYENFLKEFDYAGVFKKGMGFSIVQKYEEGLEKLKKKDMDLA